MNSLHLRLLACACCIVTLAGCGGQAARWDPSPPKPTAASDVYVVQRGDTLYQIAFRHGLDYRDVARWNGLGSGNLIYPGQRLRLSPAGGTAQAGTARSPSAPGTSAGTPPRTPAPSAGATPRSNTPAPRPAQPARPREPAPAWAWPASGELAYRFGDTGALGRGVGVRGTIGQPILAAAPGRIVYTGSGLVGYGEVIIIKHNDTYLSAYGHTRDARVSEGDEVRAGQRIAAMGEGPGRRAVLHFEIRVDGEAVDPLPLLPRR
jgi:lipoprotein NlpD